MTKIINKILRSVSILALTLFFAQNSIQDSLAQSLSQKHEEELKQVEEYLNNIKNLSANFVQTSQEGAAKGKFFLSRPGKMRIEYDKPNELVITVNDSVLAYKDVELDEISYLSTNKTPASLLTRENISFKAKDIEITKINSSDQEIAISMLKKNNKDAGEFMIIFSKNPLQFTKMEVKNDLDQATTITLYNIDFNSEINKNLFVIKNQNLP